MKKVMIALLFLSGSMAFAQAPGFGIKGGFNYGSTGDLEFSSLLGNINLESENKVGYHLGAFYKIELAGLFIQPEIAYTKLTTGYDPEEGGDLDYNLSKIDVPLLAGLNVIGPLNLKAGPSFQYILSNELDGDGVIALEDPENKFTIGYQLGAGVTLGQLGVDLRYEGAFSENDVVSSTEVQDAGFIIDSRPSQWILSLSYSFGDN